MATEIPDLGQSNPNVRDLFISVRQEMDSLKREVESLSSRLTTIEHDRPAMASEARIAEVAKLTEEMFGKPEIRFERDPEEPETEYVVFSVRVNCEPQEVVEKHIQWHRRIGPLAPGTVGQLRLSIVPSNEAG